MHYADTFGKHGVKQSMLQHQRQDARIDRTKMGKSQLETGGPRKALDAEILTRRLFRVFREWHWPKDARVLARLCADTYFQQLKVMAEAKLLPKGVVIGKRGKSPDKRAARMAQIHHELLGHNPVESNPIDLEAIIIEIEELLGSADRTFMFEEVCEQVAPFGWDSRDVAFALSKMVKRKLVRQAELGYYLAPPPAADPAPGQVRGDA